MRCRSCLKLVESLRGISDRMKLDKCEAAWHPDLPVRDQTDLLDRDDRADVEVQGLLPGHIFLFLAENSRISMMHEQESGNAALHLDAQLAITAALKAHGTKQGNHDRL